jgi:phage repressor protein C with HTH and peptisase S24 domain
MSWAKKAKEALLRGETIQIRPRGNSMQGKVESGALVTLEPVDKTRLRKGDIVLVRVRGRDYLHLIVAKQGSRFLIGNNKGGTNGWVGPQAVYGIATTIE